MKLKLVNLTPHSLIIDGTVYPVDGPAPRLGVDRKRLGEICGHAIVRSTMGAPSGLPERQDGVILVVSALVAEHPSVVGRDDLAYPGRLLGTLMGRLWGLVGCVLGLVWRGGLICMFLGC